ncbi:SusC/RagA family TonB-linked outer membrane protein [Flavobacterium hydatis]|uniref:SusC/RagA family TonB-linked outer membrane protein n=1 Tax=Flavobacterium hydatis TaxID=991 RepID=A0A085ZZ38_FLAHY|nr:TonB-dependent receptor [Flavobacterium hydatis]KFF09702.1 TonB-dependent receptor [Flavobacterium hydatis]OXA91436.1 SusC/RagA family TonB-linked outer membrane protein [Flavobacterium hydatis]
MKKLFLISLLVLFIQVTFGQTKTITGTVKNKADGIPIPGVSVLIQGTAKGSSTDFDGNYSIAVSQGESLSFSYMGFETKVVKVEGQQKVNVDLSETASKLDEVVVVGFSSQKKTNVTGAVASIDVAKTIGSRPLTDVSKALQGTTPGVNVSFNSGNINRMAKINIRGSGTVNANGSDDPLILVDGVPTDLSLINPNDVATISVLKDAASASIYGARAAFGVVLITTKGGKTGEGKVRFSYSGNTAFTNPISTLQFLDPTEEIPGLIAAGTRTDGSTPEFFGANYNTLLAGIKTWKEKYANNRTSNEMVYGEDWEIKNGTPYFYRVWDANKEMYAKNALQTSHNFSAQGNLGEKSSFFASFAITDQQGMLRVNQETRKRTNINLGFTTKLTDWLTGDFKVMTIRSSYDQPFNYYGGSGTDDTKYGGYFGYALRWGQYTPNFGTYRGYNFRTAGGYLSNASMNENDQYNNRLSAKFTAEITKDLNLITEISSVTDYYSRKQNGGKFQAWDSWSSMPYDATTIQTATPATLEAGNDFVAQSKAETRTNVVNIYANYKKQLNKHNLKFLGGFNSEWQDFSRTYARRNTLLDKTKPEFNLAVGEQFVSGATNTDLNPNVTSYSIAGFFGRVNYDYNGIYLLELNARYDGSSKFPTDQQWGFFPSASIGYKIVNESFMEGTRGWLNDLKLRASMGSIGNQNIGNNAFLSIMKTKNPSWINGGAVLPPSTELPSNVDPSLTWEKVYTKDVGIDIRIFDMLSASFDWYQRDTKGMLAPGITLPGSFGQDAAQTNSGNMRTRGWELALNFNKQINDNASVFVDLALSDYKSVVTKWNNSSKLLTTYYDGYEIGQIWGLTSDRLLQSTDVFTNNGKTVNGVDYSKTMLGSFKYGPGDVHYVDTNGDGTISRGAGTADDHGDLSKIGNTTPRYKYGITLGGKYHGIDISGFFQGVAKRDYWAASDAVLPFYRAPQQMYANQSDYWTPDNTEAYWPNPYYGNESKAFGGSTEGMNNFVTQTRYLLNMSYLRLKNVTLGYSLPKEFIKKAGLEKLRIYASGENLVTWADSRLPVDPELDESEIFWGRAYPFTKTWSFGIELSF